MDRIDYHAYLEWLEDKHPLTVLGVIKIWTEDTPFALWIKESRHELYAHVVDCKYACNGETIRLPEWAEKNERLSRQLLVIGQEVTVAQAVRILTMAFRVECQEGTVEEEVESGV